MRRDLIRTSKFLSLVLRHKPEAIGLELDEGGWVDVDVLLEACRRHGKAWGAVVPDPEFASRAAELGCRMPTIGNEVLAMRRGIQALQQAFAHDFPNPSS